MFHIKQEPDAKDLTHRAQHLLSPTMEDDDEHFSHEEDTHDCIPKVGRRFISPFDHCFFSLR